MSTQKPTSLPQAANQLREFIRDSMGHASGTSTSAIADQALAERFDSFATDLFELQFEANAAYRQFCEARGASPGRIAHWTQIPFLPVVAFKESACTGLPENERPRVFHSSGTTRVQPSRHFHNDQSLESYEASILPWFKKHLFPDFESWRGRLFGGPLEPPDFLFLTPPPAACPNSSLVHMFEVIRREHAPTANPFCGRIALDGSWSLELAVVQTALNQAVDFLRPLTILGTALSFVELAELLMNGHAELVLPQGSKAMETGGYKGRSRAMPKLELYSLITKTLGIPRENIVSEYGMSELSSQAYDCAAEIVTDGSRQTTPATNPARAFRFPPWTRARIVSPENGIEVPPGATGILQVLDMANIFSVSAVQTEDLAQRREEGFELQGRAPLSEPRGCSLRQIESPQ